MKKTKLQFINNAGGCVVSKNIINKKGQLKWCLREEPMNKNDNGWRFFSDIDTEEYINNPHNLMICDFNTVVDIEPAIIAIYKFPFGSDLELIQNDKGLVFCDSLTGIVVYPSE